ncbi:cyclin-dependent kinase inhibitor 3 isoform X4 [Petaurus breviceps papuanus]|uniref:cyclin-dependent kinase inhibitor 3 isoform X4 n=1 Tax=Petaurus breviceps papuanus TaxID=3040969 RepID=UPI0036DE20C7
MKVPSTMQTSEFDSSDEEPVENEQTPFQVSWLPLSIVNCSQFLGLCSLPGCKFKDVRRNLQKDMEELKNYGIQDIFVFCTRGELSKYRVPNLLDFYQQHGIIIHHHPIPDGDTPDIDRCCGILQELAVCLENNRKTLIQSSCYCKSQESWELEQGKKQRKKGRAVYRKTSANIMGNRSSGGN